MSRCINFGNDFEVSSRIKKGSSFVVSDSELFLLVEGIPETGSSLIIEGARTTMIALSLLRNNFLAIFIF